MIRVIKKDNTKEEFNVQKVVNAVNKSATRVMYEFTPLRSNISAATSPRRQRRSTRMKSPSPRCTT